MATAATVAAGPPIPQKASGSHFYKYGSLAEPQQLDWLKTIILGHQVYAPSLKELKDPADGKPRLAQLTQDKIFEVLCTGHSGFLERNPNLPIEAQILETARIDIGIRTYGPELLMPKLSAALNEALKDWKVYCLAKIHDSMSMWENYADNHRGYCLEFTNQGAFFSCAKEVIYGATVELDITIREHLDGWWFFCKRPEYSFEEEVRVLMKRDFPNGVKIEPQYLTRIVLGRHMPEDHRMKIREWAKQRDPQLTVVTALWDEYKQVLRLIPYNHP